METVSRASEPGVHAKIHGMFFHIGMQVSSFCVTFRSVHYANFGTTEPAMLGCVNKQLCLAI